VDPLSWDLGRDVRFVEAPQSRREFERIARAGSSLSGQHAGGWRDAGGDPEELASLRLPIAVFPLSGLFAAERVIKDMFEHL
jgi:hypothetical protein